MEKQTKCNMNRYSIVGLFVLIGLLASAWFMGCGAGRQKLPHIQAEARNIGLYIELEGDKSLQRSAITIIKQTIEKLYYTDMIIVPTIRAKNIENLDAETYFKLSELMVDDLVIVRAEVRPLASDETGLLGTMQIWNIPLGKEIAREELKVRGSNSPDGFPAGLEYEVHRVMATRFNEPGLYPRADLEKAGDLLFARDEFVLAQDMYRNALDKTDANSRFGTVVIARLREKIKKAEVEIRKRGMAKSASSEPYKESFQAFNIPDELKNACKTAYKSVGLSAALREITTRPVKFIVQFFDGGQQAPPYPLFDGYSFHVVVRFDQELYKKLIVGEPEYKDGYRALSLNPYAQVMYQILRYREELKNHITGEGREAYQGTRFYLHLVNGVDDEVAFEITMGSTGKPQAPVELIVNIMDYNENMKLISADTDATMATGYFMLNTDNPPEIVKVVTNFFGISL